MKAFTMQSRNKIGAWAHMRPPPPPFESKSDSDCIEAIIRDINYYKTNGNVFICGDLNARAGLDPEFIVNDSDKHVPLDPSYIIDSNILQRNSEDTKVDDRGKQINELCISTRMRILNGRTLGDSFGKFTCQKPTGASVVDYMIASEELLKDIIYFHVHPFLPIFSDCHSKISVCIKANAKQVKSAQKVNERMPDTFKWNKYSSQDPRHRTTPDLQPTVNIYGWTAYGKLEKIR